MITKMTGLRKPKAIIEMIENITRTRARIAFVILTIVSIDMFTIFRIDLL